MDYFKFITLENTVRLISMNNLVQLEVSKDYIEFVMTNDDHITICKDAVKPESWNEFYKNFESDIGGETDET